MSKDMIAYRCNDCNMISVIPNGIDGCSCLSCHGSMEAIGKAKIHGKSITTLSVGVEVDTTQLDLALDKAKELNRLTDNKKGECGMYYYEICGYDFTTTFTNQEKLTQEEFEAICNKVPKTILRWPNRSEEVYNEEGIELELLNRGFKKIEYQGSMFID